ncbi:MAG: hypothetical protein LBJ17_03655 [Dysgonamonadaceae bacterium]|jgi:hypothetical protein|nr:hypothetical protein [Dysgonamonadaceae bacterium]
MILIYCSLKNIARLNYVASHIFGSLSGAKFEITCDKNRYLSCEGVCINYSNEELNHGLHIVPQGLLEEKGVRQITDLAKDRWKTYFCFFSQIKGDIPFDIFSATFYLLTSYEEYFSKNLDKHRRYSMYQSVIFLNNSLSVPVIDRWTECLRDELKTLYPTWKYRMRKFRTVSTVDVDFPYQYRYKGIIKTVGGIIKDLLKKDFEKVKERIKVICRLKEDAYFEAIKWLDDFHDKEDMNYYLFVLLGKCGKYGRTTVYPSEEWKWELNNLKKALIGLHPSYDTYHNINILQKEKQELDALLGKAMISAERRHFLCYTCPESFREAEEAGFSDDFSLSFSLEPGFRSGTAVPYYFYDVEHDRETRLLIHPTVMMDTSLISHLKMSPADTESKIRLLIDECVKSGGDFTCLWHNSNIAGDNNPWKEVFLKSIQYALNYK